jgi:large subunit ribosomal protein L21
MYVVLETGSKQYRVKSGDTLVVERLNVEAGQAVTFDKILMVNNDGDLKIGAPTLDSASIVADVLEHKRGPKVLSFKKRRRKGYQKTIGHRQEQTVVRIKEINA